MADLAREVALIRSIEKANRHLELLRADLEIVAEALPRRARAERMAVEGATRRLDVVIEGLAQEIRLGADQESVRWYTRLGRRAAAISGSVMIMIGSGALPGVGAQVYDRLTDAPGACVAALEQVDRDAAALDVETGVGSAEDGGRDALLQASSAQLVDLAEVDPGGAVLLSFRNLEQALLEAVMRRHTKDWAEWTRHPRSFSDTLRDAEAAGIVDGDDRARIETLRRARNEAAHSLDQDLSRSDARALVALADEMRRLLDDA